MKCVDLWRRYGDRFVVSTDPAYQTTGIRHASLDPWYFQLPCKFGTIYPHGGSTLGVFVDYHSRIAARVGQLPGVRLWLDGDAEKTYLFPVSLFEEVARIVKPRKRRRQTPEQRASSAERLRQYQF